MSTTTERIRLLEEQVDQWEITTRERLTTLREFCDASLVAINELEKRTERIGHDNRMLEIKVEALDQKIDDLVAKFNVHTHLTQL